MCLLINDLFFYWALWHIYWHKGSEPINFITMKNKINTIYTQAERFAEITKKAIVSGNILKAKKCLEKADFLLQTGTNETKSVISNIYVYSVSTFMEIRKCSISNLFPAGLKSEYLKQINVTSV